MKKVSAVFLDRDGTINEEVEYLSRLEDLRIFPFSHEAIGMINRAGMKAVVVTNQSGVARGYFDEAFLHTLHGQINKILGKKGARIDRFYYCPHHPEEGAGMYKRDCDCRKPRTGMFQKAAHELAIDLSSSYMIGDNPTDMEAAQNVGIKGVLVRTGYGENVDLSAKASYIASDILEAVKWILKDKKR
ncbi:MAG: D-glycero-beta-D-manno-heptose 1,7-bisphosphate 7-phosphatase [Deltaproteobacteria bacterium]|nr:D-glycero-beta-D-manno-heptose 1,7-bisphosphate 7-phosphatase [Deltaproteobacteria bacterium]